MFYFGTGAEKKLLVMEKIPTAYAHTCRKFFILSYFTHVSFWQLSEIEKSTRWFGVIFIMKFPPLLSHQLVLWTSLSQAEKIVFLWVHTRLSAFVGDGKFWIVATTSTLLRYITFAVKPPDERSAKWSGMKIERSLITTDSVECCGAICCNWLWSIPARYSSVLDGWIKIEFVSGVQNYCLFRTGCRWK